MFPKGPETKQNGTPELRIKAVVTNMDDSVAFQHVPELDNLGLNKRDPLPWMQWGSTDLFCPFKYRFPTTSRRNPRVLGNEGGADFGDPWDALMNACSRSVRESIWLPSAVNITSKESRNDHETTLSSHSRLENVSLPKNCSRRP